MDSSVHALDARATSDVGNGANNLPTDGSLDGMTGSDASGDGGHCVDACTRGATRCFSGDGGTAAVQSCAVQSNGCSAWATSTSCGLHQSCSIGDAGASCACLSSACGSDGAVCQDGTTVATCSTDPQGCLFVASTMTCQSPQSCSGNAPNAGCASTCGNTCTSGQTDCVNGKLAACTLGSNGCLAYGTPGSCPSTHQSCTGAPGSASCACQADPVCSSAAAACANSTTIANCTQDAQGCFYEASTTNCGGGQVCSGGTCSCTGSTPNLCGTTCTSTATDPRNCGACGTVCPGAGAGETCSGGVCQPFSIASASAPFALTTDGVNVYYLSTASPGSSTTIAAVPIGGGTVSGPFAAPGAVTIATDAVDVYWGGATSNSEGFISLAPVGNVGTASPVISNFTDTVEVIYADTSSGFLKFAVFCDGIFSVPLRTTAATQSGTQAGSNGCVGSVAAGNFDQIFWALPSSVSYIVGSNGSYSYTTSQNSLTGLFATGQSPPQMLSTASSIKGIVVQGSAIYYTDSAGGTVSTVPTDGSKAASALALASSPLGLVADSSNVYWIDQGGAAIMKVSVNGGQSTMFATGQSATAIAQDGSSVYWTNTAGIVRMPK